MASFNSRKVVKVFGVKHQTVHVKDDGVQRRIQKGPFEKKQNETPARTRFSSQHKPEATASELRDLAVLFTEP
jgi:hypothetical protein